MQWKDIPGYLGMYEVSDTGLIRNKRNQKVLKPRPTWDGSQLVNLYYNGIPETVTVHRLVAEAFVERPERGKWVKHRDGNKQNNHPENLYWSQSKRYDMEIVI